MTTTVCDLVNSVVAADTRWSYGWPDAMKLSDDNYYMVFCDDTGVDKIAKVGKAVLVCAGDGILINEWKDWFLNSRQKASQPPVDRGGVTLVSLSIIDLHNNSVLFDDGIKYPLFCEVEKRVKGFTSGTGGLAAGLHMISTDCAISSVEHASEHDHCTSSTVRFVCNKNKTDNLDKPSWNYDDIVKGLIERGNIMKIDQKVAANDAGIPLKEHPLAKEVKDLFANGNAVASAPVRGISTVEWNDDTYARLDHAMAKVEELAEM